MGIKTNMFNRKDVELLEWIYEEFDDRFCIEGGLERLEEIIDKITKIVNEEDI